MNKTLQNIGSGIVGLGAGFFLAKDRLQKQISDVLTKSIYIECHPDAPIAFKAIFGNLRLSAKISDLYALSKTGAGVALQNYLKVSIR